MISNRFLICGAKLFILPQLRPKLAGGLLVDLVVNFIHFIVR